MAEIAIVDIDEPGFAERLLDAWREYGFVAVTNHSISPSLFREMRSLLVRLFELDDETKRDLRITPDNYRGFIPLGFFTPNRPEASGTGADSYEGFKLHWECPTDHPVRRECGLYGPNVWPADLPEMRDVVLAYWSACDALASRLLTATAPSLGIGADTLLAWHEAPLTNMTLLHYPATDTASTGIHAHKDTNVITLLHPDPAGGLAVRGQDGAWFDVRCPPEAVLVNVGEMLELWSGGELIAAPHRVVNSTGRDRYTFPYFVVPRHDITVEPLVECRADFSRRPMPVGELSAEVWRTNWPDQAASAAGHDLGTLDRNPTPASNDAGV